MGKRSTIEQPIMLSKMTAKTLQTNPAAVKIDNQKVACAEIYGAATSTGIVTDPTSGASFTFIGGVFEAHNLQNDEFYRSTVLYLPTGLHDLLQKPLQDIDEKTGKPTCDPIQFGLRLCAVPSGNPTGYSWQGESLMEQSSIPVLEQVRQKVHLGKLKLLAIANGQTIEGEAIDITPKAEDLPVTEPDPSTKVKAPAKGHHAAA